MIPATRRDRPDRVEDQKTCNAGEKMNEVTNPEEVEAGEAPKDTPGGEGDAGKTTSVPDQGTSCASQGDNGWVVWGCTYMVSTSDAKEQSFRIFNELLKNQVRGLCIIWKLLVF